MCQECQEIEAVHSESSYGLSEAWDQTVSYKSEEALLNGGIKEEVSGKICSKCGEWKPLTEFCLLKRSKDGRNTRCASCTRSYNNVRYSEKRPSTVVAHKKRERTEETKCCRKCGLEKLFLAFSLNSYSPDGLKDVCKECEHDWYIWRKSGEYVPLNRREEFPEGFRRCYICKDLLPLSLFYKDKNLEGGFKYECKSCAAEYERGRVERNKRSEDYYIKVESKICSSCKLEKKACDFPRSSKNRDGLSYVCRVCVSARCKEHAELVVYLPLWDINKVCSVCAVLKPATDFSPSKGHKDGLTSSCKSCSNIRTNERHSTLNFVADMSISKVCCTCGLEKGADLFYKSKVHTDGLSSKCKDCEGVRKAEYFKTNLEARIRRAIRGRLHYFKNHAGDSDSAIKFLGCKMSDLLLRLERMFYKNPETGEDMTWDNYGKRGWHIDHIIPLAAFSLEDELQFSYACRFDNLQPMWRKENLRKGSKLPSEMKAA